MTLEKIPANMSSKFMKNDCFNKLPLLDSLSMYEIGNGFKISKNLNKMKIMQ